MEQFTINEMLFTLADAGVAVCSRRRSRPVFCTALSAMYSADLRRLLVHNGRGANLDALHQRQ